MKPLLRAVAWWLDILEFAEDRLLEFIGDAAGRLP